MVIKEERPITMAEVVERAGDSEKSQEIKKFISGFTTLSAAEAIEIQKKLSGLDILKLKDRHIVKIIDFMPSTASELNKILSDVSLDQEEVDKILGVVTSG